MNDSDRAAIRHYLALRQAQQFAGIPAFDAYTFYIHRHVPLNCSIDTCSCQNCKNATKKYCSGVRYQRTWHGGSPCEGCETKPRPVGECKKFVEMNVEDAIEDV